ncbi:MAG: hypothetical protein M3R63_07115 [Actinomycetota bacterium]|nr:hypothetical protein [Actinomycetota bacterium]
MRAGQRSVLRPAPGRCQAAFGFIDSGFAEPLRTASEEVRDRVWTRFETLYGRELVNQYRVVLVRLGPITH